ncbi:MAG: DUF4962 domain-containing protein [Fimbriimonadaceae bacterium]|nr:DUF4962 domain-containing protein [Fimbriimonadaceae bacterium]
MHLGWLGLLGLVCLAARAADGAGEGTALPEALRVDREPELGRNLPYHPADGQAVTTNPPPLRWLPSGEVTYRVQVARSADCATPQVDRQGLIWCAEMLDQPLAPGEWYWRYGVDQAGQPTVWSRARRFTVAADLPQWVYPGRDALQVPAARPRLFITAAQLADYQQRAREGDLKSKAERLRRQVVPTIGAELPPEPAKLTGTADERRWQYVKIFRDTRPPQDQMEQAALAWLLLRDEACGQEARRRVLHFCGWDPLGSTAVTHNDEPAMWLMMRGVRAYDWTAELYTPTERAAIEQCIRVRAAEFYKLLRRRPYENNPYESHAGRIIGFLGEAALAFANEWPEAREWLDYITRIFWGVWPAWGADDGGWNEGPGYWSAYMSFGLHYVVALRNATGIDIARRPFLHQTPYYRFYLTPPASRLSPFGDGNQAAAGPAGDLLYWFSTLTRDPHLRWYAEQCRRDGGADVMGITLQDSSLRGVPPTDLPPSRHFPGVGLVTLHTNLAEATQDVAFLLRSSPYGTVSHGHNDQNCFTLEAYGEPLAIPTGYYPSYGSPHHDQWTRSTKAKCGITHDDGQGQDRGWAAKGRIDGFRSTPRVDLCSADATAAYGGRLSRAVRDLVHLRPGVFVLRDELAAAEPRAFEFWLHALDQMTIDQPQQTVLTSRPLATLETRFLAPAGLTFRQDDRYVPEPETVLGGNYTNAWHLAAVAPKAAATQFVTVLLPSPTTAPAPLPTTRLLPADGGQALELGWSEQRAVVLFRNATAATVASGELRSTARITVVWQTTAGVETGRDSGG